MAASVASLSALDLAQHCFPEVKVLRDRIQILCVEPDPDMRLVISVAMERDHGFDVAFIEDYGDCLRFMAHDLEPIDGIVLDVSPLHLGASVMLSEIRAIPHHAHTPVIYMTTDAFAKDIDLLLGTGACGVITKPFNPLKFTQRIRHLLKAERNRDIFEALDRQDHVFYEDVLRDGKRDE